MLLARRTEEFSKLPEEKSKDLSKIWLKTSKLVPTGASRTRCDAITGSKICYGGIYLLNSENVNNIFLTET